MKLLKSTKDNKRYITAHLRSALVFSNRKLLVHEEILSWQRELSPLASLLTQMRETLPASAAKIAHKKLYMSKFILIVISAILFSCKGNDKREFEKFSLSISNQNFNYDLKSGIMKIPGINFTDTIMLSEVQKDKVVNAFYKFHIDTLNGKKRIAPKNPVTMPDFSDVIKVKVGNIEKLELNISNQIETKSDLNKTEIEIYEFKKQLIEILNENSDFSGCMDTLKSNYKNLPPAI